tara:strand:- start:1777 stop:3138 length:1362 start_codon:yes stop_codon:yes gene_type:complete
VKYVFAFAGSSVYRHLEGVIFALLEQGHEVVIVTTIDDGSSHPNVDGKAILEAEAIYPSLSIEGWSLSEGCMSGMAILVRELLNYSTYFRRGHPSTGLRQRWKKYLPAWLWRIVGNPLAGHVLASSAIQRFIRFVESKIAPDPTCRDWLRHQNADAVIACPYVLPYSHEVEYIKAAKALGIPTFVVVQSWDNLTTKGTFPIYPDRIFLWNDALKQEAVSLHGCRPEQIEVTGSPTFDYWFSTRPTLGREAFAAQCGIDPARPYFVYLCSSRGMIEEEKSYVADLKAQMQANPLTADATLLVRPHPLNILDWSGMESDRLKVWPPRGEFTDNPQARQNYLHTLHYSAGAIGVNTSAMLEVAIADKPCITVIDKRYESAQAGMGHFRHMLDGGFLQVAHSYGEAASCLGAILQGHDRLQDARRQFVARFVRPCGLNEPVAGILAHAIVSGATKTP